MTRVYAARKLLEHGPLTMAQMAEITGWTMAQVSTSLACLDKCGLLVVTDRRHGKKLYSL